MSETIREQKCCYLSTPEHIRSFKGIMLYIYTDKGELSLSSESLVFTSKKTSIEIPVDLITEINSGHYSRIAKPIRLDYIAVTHHLKGIEETILLTPTQSWATPVWKTNKLVESWKASLEKATHKA